MATVVCVGHTSLDRVFTVEAVVPPPAKVRASSFTELGGGMAGNAAVAIAHLGGTARFWGPAGDDDIADRMHADFVRHGVDATHMRRFNGKNSSHSAILVDARGERLIVNARGDALGVDAGWLPLDTLPACKALLADVRWPVGSKVALEAARRAGIPTVLDGDTAEKEVLDQLAGLADYCVFSEPGFRSFNRGRMGDDDIADGLGAAIALGARVAAVTLGERGCAWLDAGQPGFLHFTPAYAVKAVDTTGAGDAFHGAVTLLATEAAPLEAMFRFASAAAAIKVGRAGARSMPTRGEVEQFLTTH
jgi:sulfofructose kinase